MRIKSSHYPGMGGVQSWGLCLLICWCAKLLFWTIRNWSNSAEESEACLHWCKSYLIGSSGNLCWWEMMICTDSPFLQGSLTPPPMLFLGVLGPPSGAALGVGGGKSHSANRSPFCKWTGCAGSNPLKSVGVLLTAVVSCPSSLSSLYSFLGLLNVS